MCFQMKPHQQHRVKRKRVRSRKRTTESLTQSKTWPVNAEAVLQLPNQKKEPPSLSIIDFNNLTRGGLDLATGYLKNKNKNKNVKPKKTLRPKRKSRKSRGTMTEEDPGEVNVY